MEVIEIDKKEKVLKPAKNATFKLTELKMDVKEDILTIRLKVPLLNPKNYVVEVSEGVLTLKVMLAKIETNYGEFKKKPVFVESFLILPSSDFNMLLNTQYSDGGLHISIAKNNHRSLISSDTMTGVA